MYLLHLLKTLTNAPALIAPTQLLAASGRRDEALYQALGARLRTRRVRAVLCVGRRTDQNLTITGTIIRTITRTISKLDGPEKLDVLELCNLHF